MIHRNSCTKLLESVVMCFRDVVVYPTMEEARKNGIRCGFCQGPLRTRKSYVNGSSVRIADSQD